MQDSNRVVWSEGMFLRVQQFQQADRFTEHLVREAVRDLVPHGWGVAEIEFEQDLLNIGRFAVARCRGVLPDGTPFRIPADADHPEPLELPAGVHGAVVHLTLPVRQGGAPEIGGDGRDDMQTRFRRSTYQATDGNAGAFAEAPVEIARLRLGFGLDSGPTAGFVVLPLARVVEVRADLSVQLDDRFILPCLNVGCQPPLMGFLAELQGLITHRAEAISARMADPTIRGTAEIADFLLLQALNRAEPGLRHMVAEAASLHPERMYAACVALAGELSTFTAASKRAAVFPAYRHSDLQATFAPVIADLRASLSTVLEQTAVAIPLVERRHGVRVGSITDRSLIATASFVLSVRADMPAEQLRRAFPNQVKIGPVEQISQLVNVSLPGITVRAMPVAPRQLPYRAGSIFFELDRSGPFWKQLDTSGAIALHLAGEFPQLELELWAIKD